LATAVPHHRRRIRRAATRSIRIATAHAPCLRQRPLRRRSAKPPPRGLAASVFLARRGRLLRQSPSAGNSILLLWAGAIVRRCRNEQSRDTHLIDL
jgi:hypothetical protein